MLHCFFLLDTQIYIHAHIGIYIFIYILYSFQSADLYYEIIQLLQPEQEIVVASENIQYTNHDDYNKI